MALGLMAFRTSLGLALAYRVYYNLIIDQHRRSWGCNRIN